MEKNPIAECNAGNHVLQMHRWNFKKTASVSMTAMEEFCICRTMPVM